MARQIFLAWKRSVGTKAIGSQIIQPQVRFCVKVELFLQKLMNGKLNDIEFIMIMRRTIFVMTTKTMSSMKLRMMTTEIEERTASKTIVIHLQVKLIQLHLSDIFH